MTDMDPDACYLTIYESMRDGDLATAREHALALKEWLDKGGFYPQHYSHQEVTAYLAHALRRTVPYRRGQHMTNPYQAAKRRYPALRQRFDDQEQFLGDSLPLWARGGKTWCTVHLDNESRMFWSDGWEHIWHWKDQGIFRVVHHGPATYGASTFFLNF